MRLKFENARSEVWHVAVQRLDGIVVALAGELCILLGTSAVDAATLISQIGIVQGPRSNTLVWW